MQGALASESVASAVVVTVVSVVTVVAAVVTVVTVSVAVVPDSGTARLEGRPLRQGTSLGALH